METQERLIYIDDLTGLYNRRYLYSHLPKEIQESQLQNYNLWLFMMDIDNFKMINDTYGHLYGDEVIKEVATLIKEGTKAEDKKIRYAGDEFTLILTKMHARDIVGVAERLLAKVRIHVFRHPRTGKEVKVTVSIGIAGCPQDTVDPTALINLADKALYISKQKGRNCCSVASEITADLFWKKDLLEHFPCRLFINRQQELALLQDKLSAGDPSSGRLLLLTGELGIGKSRLLNEYEQWAYAQESHWCFSVRCKEKCAAQSFYTVGEALYKFLASRDALPEGAMEGLTQEEVGALYAFMPALKQMRGAAIVPEAAFENKIHLPAGLVKVFRNLSRVRPIYFFFDDLHYIDAQSLEVVLALVHERREFPVCCLAAFSEQDLDQEAEPLALGEFLKKDAAQAAAQMVALGPLAQDAVRQMVGTILTGIPVTSSLVGEVCAITKGNPLFVEELLKYLIEKEYLSYLQGEWVEKAVSSSELPASIEETIRRRLEDLSSEAKDMIAKAAVIGDDFQVDLLQKIDSEDRGYVLDLIEGAKKVGLVYERGIAGKDEFSFVTGEIRKMLLNLTNNDQRKHFHSRLGQIKEELHPENLASIAGELYYNFKKAEDWVRAEQYARMIKEGSGSFYDQTIKYAQSLLQEVEQEKRASPLSTQALQMVPELIRQIYIASVNYVLYPPESKIRLSHVAEVHRKLEQLFVESEVVKISAVADVLLVNNRKLTGKEAKGAFVDGFLALLKDANIEGVVFERGLTPEDLTHFIQIMNAPALRDSGVAAALEDAGLQRVRVDEISYYELSRRPAREKESLQEIMLMDYLLGKLHPAAGQAAAPQGIPTAASHAEEINQALEKLGAQASRDTGKDKESVKTELMVKSIQKIGNQLLHKNTDEWAQQREQLASVITSMEPQLRANILTAPVIADTRGHTDVIKELALNIPDDVIIDVLIRQYRQKDNTLLKMRELVDRFLATPEKKEQFVPLLKERFCTMGAKPEEAEWMLGQEKWHQMSLEERAEKIISLPVSSLGELVPLMKIAGLLKELFAKSQYTLAQAVMERLLLVLEEEYPRSAVLAVHCTDALNVFLQESPRELFLRLMQMLLKVSAGKDELVVSILTPLLERTLMVLISEGRFGLAKEVVNYYAKQPAMLEKNARQFDAVLTGLIESLDKALKEHQPWEEISGVITLYGSRAIRPLLAHVLQLGSAKGSYDFETYLNRITIAKVLSSLPREELVRQLEESFRQPEPVALQGLIELVGAMEDEGLTGLLSIPLGAPDQAVRKKTLFVLGRMKTISAVGLLCETLKKADEPLQEHILKLLAYRSDAASAGVINRYAQDPSLDSRLRQALTELMQIQKTGG